ncbi:MAG TPA: MinD/ParA family protein [Candidatus Acidoferrum sp.]|nr:MinD/ParA family protein [Candidatus Acidoferrum sp.]
MSVTRISKALGKIAEPPEHGARVIAISSGKGGVGKSSITVNLAVAMAASGQSVLVLDADLGLANIDVMLGIRPKYDLFHVITGQKTLDEIVVNGPHGIGIVPAASGVSRMTELACTEHAGLIHAFDALNRSVDVMLIDTAAGIADSVRMFCKAAQEVVVVVCDEPASITDAYALIKVLNQDHKVKRFQVLCNMVQHSQHGRQLYAKLAKVADTYLDVSLGYLGCIPADEKLKQSVRRQQSVIDAFPYSASAVAFRSMADALLALPVPVRSSGFIEFFAGQGLMAKAAVGGA